MMKGLTGNRRKAGIAATAFGGFLIMIGIVMMGIFVLVLFNILDITTFMEPQFRTLFIFALLAIGVCDLISGIILALR